MLYKAINYLKTPLIICSHIIYYQHTLLRHTSLLENTKISLITDKFRSFKAQNDV